MLLPTIFANFANTVQIRPSTTMFLTQTFTANTAEFACIKNIVVVGLTQTKLTNLANTEVKREVVVTSSLREGSTYQQEYWDPFCQYQAWLDGEAFLMKIHVMFY